MSHLISRNHQDPPRVTKTVLSPGKFQGLRGYLPGTGDKGQTSLWAETKFLTHGPKQKCLSSHRTGWTPNAVQLGEDGKEISAPTKY